MRKRKALIREDDLVTNIFESLCNGKLIAVVIVAFLSIAFSLYTSTVYSPTSQAINQILSDSEISAANTELNAFR